MRRMSLAVLFAVLPLNMAIAHTGIGPTVGFANGLLHPLSGLDHVLAMVLVGMFGVQIGGRAVWALPLAFVTMMIAGGALGMASTAIPFVEIGIALSVLILGAAIALQWKPSVAVGVLVAAAFALFHGHAHGAEMPVSASGFFYGAGFVAATVALHASGIVLGLALRSLRGDQILPRLVGAASALVGIGLVVATAG